MTLNHEHQQMSVPVSSIIPDNKHTKEKEREKGREERKQRKNDTRVREDFIWLCLILYLNMYCTHYSLQLYSAAYVHYRVTIHSTVQVTAFFFWFGNIPAVRLWKLVTKLYSAKTLHIESSTYMISDFCVIIQDLFNMSWTENSATCIHLLRSGERPYY